MEPRDVRADVLAASAELLESRGLAALSMREVARQAGVTHQAPYRHFADRESVLAALVEQGFDELAMRLAAALDTTAPSAPRMALIRSGLAYVEFASSRPRLFGMMFHSDFVDLERFPAAEAAGGRALAQLERLVARLGHPGSPAIHASLHWSLVHGLAGLLTDGALGRKLGSGRAEHAREVLEHFADILLPPRRNR